MNKNIASKENNQKIKNQILKHLEKTNKDLRTEAKIQACKILKTGFSKKEGTLTSSLKIKRQAIEKLYAKDIDFLYSSKKKGLTIFSG